MIEVKPGESYKHGRRFLYLLDGQLVTLDQLSKLPVPLSLGLTKQIILNRINGVKNGKVKKYKDLISILTTPMGGKGSWAYKSVQHSTSFIELMMNMPVNNSKPRIMQSRPIL